jgi:hypothetical protein
MAFIVESIPLPPDTHTELSALFERYYSYLKSVREDMPQNAYSFAIADWHYDHSDPRCPHDGWLETLIVKEPSSGERSELREVEIRVELLGAFHDGLIELTYPGVRSYLLQGPRNLDRSAGLSEGHGDWMIDEVRLSDKGNVLHEVKFSGGSRWTIESEDIVHRWKPFKE